MPDLLDKTLARLRAGVAAEPSNGGLWLQLAELLADVGRTSEAREACLEALRHLADPDARTQAQALLGRTGPEPAAFMDNVLRVVQGQQSGSAEGDDEDLVCGVEEPLSFADVGGLDAVKEEIRMKIVLPFRNPDLFRTYGKKAGGGILLYGPPGCGKTMLARATAGECQAHFLAVAIDKILDMYFGESERKLGVLFEQARSRPAAVLFFDELEAIGASRQQIRHSPGKSLVNQLLAEMDGVGRSNQRMLVMAATNAPWHVDPALRRPGRFDRVIFVPPPDRAARVEILRLHLRNRPVDSSVDLADLAKRTEGYSGADLFDLVDRAVERPLREALAGGAVRPLNAGDLDHARKASKPTTREWFQTAKNYATFANTGGLYDDLLKYLETVR